MLTQSQVELLRPRITQLKMVFAALIGGVVVFALVAIVPQGVSFNPNLSLLSEMFLGMGGLLVVMSLVIPNIIVKSTIQQQLAEPQDQTSLSKTDRAVPMLLQAWFVRSIVGASMLEAGVFMNLIAVMIDGHGANLIAAIVITAMITIFFPTENRVVEWIETQMSELK